ncbi:hypothetical protein CDD83_2275 [Cordyceps sp. RAO-2017]|nr:hypothetical protein CDD83_2275 [Cordyceps sp. RAO-2017]
MFLHSGAGLHGHEYSNRASAPVQPPQPPPTRQRHPLLRTALLPLASPDSGASMRHFGQPDSPSPRASYSPEDSPRPSSLSSHRRSAPGGFARKDLAVRFREPQTDAAQTPLASEDEGSVTGSELADGTEPSARRASRRKRAPRKSTRFALAHPAPQLRTKQRRLVQIRPRLLLQLQEIGDRRAIPSFDVVPSSLVAGNVIIPRLAKRFPRLFRAKPELGQDDVLVVRSDDYGPPTPDSSSPYADDADDGKIDDRDVLAVISARPHAAPHCAEIALEDGSTWLAAPMANGSFEFTHIDDRGFRTTARWVRRSLASTRNSTASMASFGTAASDQAPASKWTFSIMDPSSRRHPVMGSLTPESVEVYDSYNTLSSSSGRYPPTRPFGPDAAAFAGQEDGRD